MLNNNFIWGPLPQNDIDTIDREINIENVYNKYRNIKNGDVIFDIGASVGPFTCSILKNKPYIVHCVEPSLDLINILQENIKDYKNNQTKLIYHNNAICSTDNSNVFCNNNPIKSENFKQFIESNNISHVDFMKIDCEGCEYDIFDINNLEFLQCDVKYIAAEFHLTYPGNREKFIYFRDNILNKFKSYKIESCTKQQIAYGYAIDLTQYIYDNNFINTYNHTLMIYIDNDNIIELFSMFPDNPYINYRLAEFYYIQGHTASAFTHYLRCAERTSDIELSYNCLIKSFLCFDKQGNRDFTATHLLKQAISLDPKRPEAYFYLSKYYEYKKQYYESYTYASIALDVCLFDKFSDLPDYPGIVGLLFNKAVSGYWWDKRDESRALFNYILENHSSDIPINYLKMIEYNLTEIEKQRQTHTKYRKEQHAKLKYKFTNSCIIEENYSQSYQDLFVLSVTNGKNNGTYLEIGAGDPIFGNNTYLLEKLYNWTGISLEIKSDLADRFRSIRKNSILCCDATKQNYRALLNSYYTSDIIDYLQIDCEPPDKTFEILLSIPFDQYKFGIITYEHDYYLDITKSYRSKSRNYLRSLGYKLIIPDVSIDNSTPFEDWWIHPDIIDQNIFNDIMQYNIGKINPISNYILAN